MGQSVFIKCGISNTCTFSHSARRDQRPNLHVDILSVGWETCVSTFVCYQERWGRRSAMAGLGSESGWRRLRARSSDTHISHSARDAKGKRWITSRLLLSVFGSRARGTTEPQGGAKYLHRSLWYNYIFASVCEHSQERRALYCTVLMAIKVETCCSWPFVPCASLCFTLFVLSQHNKQPDA
jgi:hypothetical protein